MKAIPLLILSASVFAVGLKGSAQAVVGTVQLTQQSVQNTKSASQGQSVHVNQHAPQTGEPAAQANLQPSIDSHRTSVDCHCANAPFLSLNSSDVPPGTEITISSTDPNAVIYYTTDGWTPTSASPRYTGPVTVNATTRLQAIAVVPQKLPSPVIEADYLVNGAAPRVPTDVFVDGSVLTKGTPLLMMTATKVNSETANIGDHVSILLDQNVIAGGIIVAPKGMSVDASVAWVERSGRGGKPGMVIFKVQSFQIHGTSVPLDGILTLEAPNVAAQTRRISNPDLVQISGPLPPGNPALIQPGMTFTAVVAADTPVNP